MGAASEPGSDVRYMAAELGRRRHPRQRDLGGADQKTARRRRIKGFRKHAVVGGEGLGAASQRLTIEEVGNAAAFLSSISRSGITGEILYVDAGFNIMGFSLRRRQGEARRAG